MRLGMIVRGEQRGLGILTAEAWRHLDPAVTIAVDMGALARGFAPDFAQYPGAAVAAFDGATFTPDAVAAIRDLLPEIDVLWTAETFYDWRILDWCRDAGVATVNLCMPEFFRADMPRPDVIWNPTTWRMGSLPPGTVHVPVPVALDRFPEPAPRRDGPLRVLHNAGHRAAADRNGTLSFLAAIPHMGATPAQPIEVTVSGQDGRLPVPRSCRGIQYTSKPRGSAAYWQVPVGFDLIVQPRRYGGLSLPVQEALAAGCVPVMPACPPNPDWPIIPVPYREHGEIDTPAGRIPLVETQPADIGRTVAVLAADEAGLRARRQAAYEWAAQHSWDALTGVWLDELDRAADR